MLSTAYSGRLVLVLSVLLAATGGCRKASTPPSASTAAAVACLGHLIPGDGVVAIGAPYAQGGGPSLLAELRVRRGEQVEAGQILAVLQNHETAAAELAVAQAAVELSRTALERVRAGAKADEIAAQRAAVAQREAAFENERVAFARARVLHEQGNISQAEFEIAERLALIAERGLLEARHRAAALEEIRAVDVSLAEKEEALAKAQLLAAEARLEQTVVRAPRRGVILDTHLQPGELVLASLLSFGAVDAMGVEAYVYDSDIRRVQRGAPARITSHAFEGALTGMVTEIAPVVDSAPAAPLQPEAAADRRVVKARIVLAADDVARVAHLSNQQVEVLIGR
jgi:HlyD family secretion protein